MGGINIEETDAVGGDEESREEEESREDDEEEEDDDDEDEGSGEDMSVERTVVSSMISVFMNIAEPV